jgi:hypothetical protein
MMTIEEVVVCFTVGNGTTTDATFELIQSESFNRYFIISFIFWNSFRHRFTIYLAITWFLKKSAYSLAT